MLYDRWMELARARRGDTALRDLASGRSWTFAQLSNTALPKPEGGVVHPTGRGADFVLQVLSAWKHRRVVCPLETSVARPHLPPESPPLEIVHLKTSSATTGQARLIAFTGAQLAADTRQIVTTMGLRPDWPNLGVISLAHSYGYSSLVLPLLLHGIPLILLESPLPEAVRRASVGVPFATLPAVPAMWRAWHDAGAIPQTVRLAITAGAPMPLALEQAIHERQGLKVHNFYGASECGGIAYDREATPRLDAACVGTAMDGVDLSVHADSGLEVRGAAVGRSYWPEADDALCDGRFRTGDLVELDGGKVFIRGRLTDLINVAGRKLAPESIERVLLQHPSVRDCLAFGVPSRDPQRGDDIVVWVAAEEAATNRDLRAFLLDRLPSWQMPREWRRADCLDVNERGKRSRAEWRARYLETKSKP